MIGVSSSEGSGRPGQAEPKMPNLESIGSQGCSEVIIMAGLLSDFGTH